MTEEEALRHARENAGALLPGVDPDIAEIVLSTFMANEGAHIADIVAALVSEAPPEISRELISAAFEFVLCREKGHLYWLETTAGVILVGARPVPHEHTVQVGSAKWPIGALLAGPPKMATIHMPDGVRRVWLACEPLDGTVVRQSEAIALGNAMIELFGGRIIEDRMGPETLQRSFIEANMTTRAKQRAEAFSMVEQMTIEARQKADLRPGHAKVAAAEALPNSLRVGDQLHPEDQPTKIYEVLRRVSDSWVVLVAVKPGAQEGVGASSWVKLHGHQGPFGSDGPPDWAFTDSPAIAGKEATDAAGPPAEGEQGLPGARDQEG